MTTVKQYRYATLLTASNSKKEAALKAGYSANMAAQPSVIENSEGFKGIAKELDLIVTDNQLAQHIVEGLVAERTTYDKHGNGYSDADWGVRHRYCETALKVKNVLKGRADNVDKSESLVAIKWL